MLASYVIPAKAGIKRDKIPARIDRSLPNGWDRDDKMVKITNICLKQGVMP